MNFVRLLAAGLCAAVLSPCQSPATRDLTQASLEDLMDMQVTSVSRKQQTLSQAGAAAFVITQEDIRRSGATNIPDLLRMAPGVDVAQINRNAWAISIRGFNDHYADKVLVLIDGRSVYSPSFSGVFWEDQDVPLEDIERIEVIRGPGGTVWGANAVNGVINIITKHSADTQGGLITAGTGPETTADGLVQYGGFAGKGGTYRIFGRYFNLEPSLAANATEGADGAHAFHTGFRSDWNLSQWDSLTVQGDAFQDNDGESVTLPNMRALPAMSTLNTPVTVNAGNVLARWGHVFAGGSDMSLQVYDDYSHHTEYRFSNLEKTLDVDFQHHLVAGSRNEIVWGGGVRFVSSDYSVSPTLTILPNHRFDKLFSAFAQDQVKLTKTISLTIGSKLEHNDFTGFEFEPSAQLVWAVTKKQMLWASASRAIREPSPVDDGLQDISGVVPAGNSYGVIEVIGNPELNAERVNDYEAGYRTQWNKRLSLDVAGFLSFYHGVAATGPLPAYFTDDAMGPHLVFPLEFVNGAPVRTNGVEIFGTWKATGHWRLIPSYTFFHMSADQPGTQNGGPGSSPEHEFQVRSLFDLGHHWEWDSTVGYVGQLWALGVPAYTRVDTRVGRRIGEHLELSVVGQNLLTPRHEEFVEITSPLNETLVERSIFAKLTWRF